LSYDFYATYPCNSEKDIEAVVDDQTLNVQTRIDLLASALVTNKDFARTGDRRRDAKSYKSLVYDNKPHQTPFANKLITSERNRMQHLGLWQPRLLDMRDFPQGSMFLQFEFRLVSPYISRDDAPFHILDNPVRKDKVFKVPMVSATAWKGSLRWVATHLAILDWQEHQNVERFATDRFHLARLFGDEKGEEGGKASELAKYLDKQVPGNGPIYREKIRTYYQSQIEPPENNTLPHHAGCLHTYPTFFDCIGLEVINPHNRETRAGIQPLYFESVPPKATGTFSLLYASFGIIELSQQQASRQISKDLLIVVKSVVSMLTLYGFGAKTSSGFGLADNRLVKQAQLAPNIPGQSPIMFEYLDDLAAKVEALAANLGNGEGATP
jgi:CRISPR-associated protein Cmr2